LLPPSSWVPPMFLPFRKFWTWSSSSPNPSFGCLELRHGFFCFEFWESSFPPFSRALCFLYFFDRFFSVHPVTATCFLCPSVPPGFFRTFPLPCDHWAVTWLLPFGGLNSQSLVRKSPPFLKNPSFPATPARQVVPLRPSTLVLEAIFVP